MNETVKVLVRMPATFQDKAAVVEVPEEAFRTKCWKTIAALAAAVELELPFVDVKRVARYGLRKEDKKRLFGESAPHPSPAATPSPQGEGIERR